MTATQTSHESPYTRAKCVSNPVSSAVPRYRFRSASCRRSLAWRANRAYSTRSTTEEPLVRVNPSASAASRARPPPAASAPLCGSPLMIVPPRPSCGRRARRSPPRRSGGPRGTRTARRSRRLPHGRGTRRIGASTRTPIRRRRHRGRYGRRCERAREGGAPHGTRSARRSREHREPELAVGVAPRDRVVVHRLRPLVDDAGAAVFGVARRAACRLWVERLVLRLGEQFDRPRDVALAVDLPREDDEVDLAEEVGGEPALDRAVDECLHVLGVSSADHAMPRIQRLGERLEARGRVDLGDHLNVGVQVIRLGHQLRHAHGLVRVLVVARRERHPGLVREPDLARPSSIDTGRSSNGMKGCGSVEQGRFPPPVGPAKRTTRGARTAATAG